MDIKFKNKEYKAPDFFIIGAAKSGTTTLHFLLNQHPQIFFPKRIKELLFFNNEKKFKDEKETLNYLRLFEEAREDQLIGESSALYFHTYEVPKRINEFYKEESKKLKFILILRNPMKRFFSNYLMGVRDGWEKRNINELINSYKKSNYEFSIEFSLYSKQLENWLKYFDRSQIKVIVFEEFVKNPKRFLDEICGFLGIERFKDYPELEQFNVGGIPKNRVFAFIYRLMNNNFVKKAVLTILPYDLANYIADKIRKNILKKPEIEELISKENLEYLKKLFKEDKETLERMLNKKIDWKV
jgi:hypothetical protein